MLSVNSEAAANVSFQGAAQWSRSNQAPGNDIFAALVDSNTANDASNAASTAQQQPSAASNNANDTPPPADNSGPANNTAANH